jgi:hypothetical protein
MIKPTSPAVRWLVALVLLSCGDDSASDTPGVDRSMPGLESVPATCELPGGGYSADCDLCLAAQCCEAITACKTDATCSLELGCVVDCQYADEPSVCSMACSTGSSSPRYAAYLSCSFEQCLATCWM